MAYSKVNWQNGATALSAENFNHMDEGIADAHEKLSEATQQINDITDNYCRKDELYGNSFDSMVTIPRTLSDSNTRATFDYTFPADGYLNIISQTNNDFAISSQTLGVYGADNDSRWIQVLPFNFPKRIILATFVKKGMRFKGSFITTSADNTAAVDIRFYPLKLRTE